MYRFSMWHSFETILNFIGNKISFQTIIIIFDTRIGEKLEEILEEDLKKV